MSYPGAASREVREAQYAAHEEPVAYAMPISSSQHDTSLKFGDGAEPPPPAYEYNGYAGGVTSHEYYEATGHSDAGGGPAAVFVATESVAPPPPRRIVVIGEPYYGARSSLFSILLFFVSPPCALIPCFAPCDTQYETITTTQPLGGGPPVVVQQSASGRRNNRAERERARERARQERAAMMAAPSAPRHFLVTIPMGAHAGTRLSARAPDGPILQFVVPPGAPPGVQIAVQY